MPLTNAQIGALGAGAGGLLSGAGNVVSTVLANRANRKLAEYSYEQQRQMIAEQNAYNSPVQQMARYAEAGLNPNLIYGSGQASAGNQSQIAKYDAPRMDAPNVELGVTGALQMALAYRQAEADIALKQEQAYAQKMLGLGYQQDYYQKQVETAVKSMQAGLKTPSGVWSQDELEQIRHGNRLRHYDLEISGMQAAQALQAAQTAVSRLNAREKQFFYDKILPLQETLLFLQAKGESYEVIRKKIVAETERMYRMSGIGSNPFRAGYVLGGVLGDKLREIWQDAMDK